jgi:hypothetical protein
MKITKVQLQLASVGQPIMLFAKKVKVSRLPYIFVA